MPLAEYQSWCDYAQIEPWGSHFDDLRAGQICAVLGNAHRDSKQRSAPFVPLDFVPWNDAAHQQAQPKTYADANAHTAALLRLMGVH